MYKYIVGKTATQAVRNLNEAGYRLLNITPEIIEEVRLRVYGKDCCSLECTCEGVEYERQDIQDILEAYKEILLKTKEF